jgi:hypothetical protein
MIVKKLRQVGGGRFPAAAYNEEKVQEGVAELLFARNVDKKFLWQLDIMHVVGINASSEVERYMKDHSITYGNSKTQNKQFHVALSVKEHEMNKYELAEFAESFMDKMGYGQQPYFVYFHHDTANNHVHILSTSINRFGIAISDSFDKMRMQHVADEILGITPDKEKQKVFSYKFKTEGQFLNVARSCGYNPKAEIVDGIECYMFFRNHSPQFSITKDEVRKRMITKDNQQALERKKQRAKQLKAILLKYRQQSLLRHDESTRGHAKRKSDLEDRKTIALSGLCHKDGTPLGENERLQMKWLVKEVKQKLGVDIHWQKDKNGIVRGYGIVDHKTKTAFDGSQVLKLTDLIDAQQKEQKGKGQKVIGTRGNDSFIAENVDSISIAKHKNGKHYLRVSYKDYDRSEMFFLSREETLNYLKAKDVAEREQLKQKFAAKHLLQVVGGSHDENREWEVGHSHYDVDDERTLKR